MRISQKQLEHARSLLLLKHCPDKLPCREAEFEAIESLISESLDQKSGSCIFISGVPGTGKTATATRVIENLSHSYCFVTISLNALNFTDPSQAILSLCHSLTNTRTANLNNATALIESHLNTLKIPLVLLIDELDHMVTRSQKLLYNLFDWPNRPNSKFILVAIANTMDLPERIFLNKISSRVGLSRVNFMPYKHTELIIIIQSRLEKVKFFDKESIEFISRNVASVSGDARRALEICRDTINIIQSDVSIKPSDAASLALKNSKSSSSLVSLRCATRHQLIFLAALLKRARLSGVVDQKLLDVVDQHISYCRTYKQVVPDFGMIHQLAMDLSQMRWIIVDSGPFDSELKVKLNISEEDILGIFKETGSDKEKKTGSDKFFAKLFASFDAPRD